MLCGLVIVSLHLYVIPECVQKVLYVNYIFQAFDLQKFHNISQVFFFLIEIHVLNWNLEFSDKSL